MFRLRTISYIKPIGAFLKDLEKKNKILEIYCGEKYIQFFPNFNMVNSNFPNLTTIPLDHKVGFTLSRSDDLGGHVIAVTVFDKNDKTLFQMWNVNEVSRTY